MSAHWWQRTVVVEKIVPDRMDQWYRTKHQRYEQAMQDKIAEHHPFVAGTPGIGDYADRLFCSVCKTPWPCWFIRWALDVMGADLAEPWATQTKRITGEIVSSGVSGTTREDKNDE